MLIKTLLVAGLCLELSACKKVQECPPSSLRELGPSAGCLVFNDQQVLVVQGYSGKISFPGGSSDTGEKAFCTAIRETREETGLAVNASRVIKQFENGFWLYDCEVADHSIAINPPFSFELVDVFWLTPDDFEQYTWRYPSQRAWLKKRMQRLASE
jgi:8-oxo-dGTP pyrophosphatase MutT (NUDIX family)